MVKNMSVIACRKKLDGFFIIKNSMRKSHGKGRKFCWRDKTEFHEFFTIDFLGNLSHLLKTAILNLKKGR